MSISEADLKRLRANLAGTTGTARAKRTRQNNANRAAGASFEKRLDAYHEQLMVKRRAIVHRTQPQVRLISGNQAIVTGKGPCDYFAWLPNGKSVFFDAKSRSADFTLGDDYGHQTNLLRSMAAFGHTAGFLVWWAAFEECRWHHVTDIEKRVRRVEGIPIPHGIEWLDLLG